jgi:hypothetical protein
MDEIRIEYFEELTYPGGRMMERAKAEFDMLAEVARQCSRRHAAGQRLPGSRLLATQLSKQGHKIGRDRARRLLNEFRADQAAADGQAPNVKLEISDPVEAAGLAA